MHAVKDIRPMGNPPANNKNLQEKIHVSLSIWSPYWANFVQEQT